MVSSVDKQILIPGIAGIRCQHSISTTLADRPCLAISRGHIWSNVLRMDHCLLRLMNIQLARIKLIWSAVLFEGCCKAGRPGAIIGRQAVSISAPARSFRRLHGLTIPPHFPTPEPVRAASPAQYGIHPASCHVAHICLNERTVVWILRRRIRRIDGTLQISMGA